MPAFASTALVLIALAQNPPPPVTGGGASFQLADLEKKLTAAGTGWLPFLSAPSLDSGLYRLPKGATDSQSPHDRDEVYGVLAGRATLEIAGVRHVAQPGSVLFVAAFVPHRFVDIQEDLTVVVFFSSAIPTTGGMAAAGKPPTRQTPYPETSPRGSTRIFYWYGPKSAGQVEIDYGLPAWQASYAGMLDQKATQRWRFGQNFWTRLDTNMELSFGDVKLPAGEWYLVLEVGGGSAPRLIALDPAAIRSQRLDAYQAPATTGGIALPLVRADDAVVSQRLRITLTLAPEEQDQAQLEVRFGPHRLTTQFEMDPQ